MLPSAAPVAGTQFVDYREVDLPNGRVGSELEPVDMFGSCLGQVGELLGRRVGRFACRRPRLEMLDGLVFSWEFCVSLIERRLRRSPRGPASPTMSTRSVAARAVIGSPRKASGSPLRGKTASCGPDFQAKVGQPLQSLPRGVRAYRGTWRSEIRRMRMIAGDEKKARGLAACLFQR